MVIKVRTDAPEALAGHSVGILLIALALAAFGLMVQYSAGISLSSSNRLVAFERQLMYLPAALFAGLLVYRIDLDVVRRHRWWILGAAIVAGDAIASSGLPFLDLAANQIEFAKAMEAATGPAFEALGLKLEAVTVQSVSRSTLSTVLGVERPSITTTPSAPQSNFRVAPRPLLSPTLARRFSVQACMSIVGSSCDREASHHAWRATKLTRSIATAHHAWMLVITYLSPC